MVYPVDIVSNVIYQDSHPGCRWAEIGSLMKISRSPIIFRASSGQIGCDGDTDSGLTAAADCTCNWSDFLFVQWSYLLSARDISFVDKKNNLKLAIKIIDNCLHVFVIVKYSRRSLIRAGGLSQLSHTGSVSLHELRLELNEEFLPKIGMRSGPHQIYLMQTRTIGDP